MGWDPDGWSSYFLSLSFCFVLSRLVSLYPLFLVSPGFGICLPNCRAELIPS